MIGGALLSLLLLQSARGLMLRSAAVGFDPRPLAHVGHVVELDSESPQHADVLLRLQLALPQHAGPLSAAAFAEAVASGRAGRPPAGSPTFSPAGAVCFRHAEMCALKIRTY